jgi:putative transposase
VPKLAIIMDEAATDVLAHMPFPREHRVQLRSTKPIERVTGHLYRPVGNRLCSCLQLLDQ